jgi:hypothetical protein
VLKRICEVGADYLAFFDQKHMLRGVMRVQWGIGVNTRFINTRYIRVCGFRVNAIWDNLAANSSAHVLLDKTYSVAPVCTWSTFPAHRSASPDAPRATAGRPTVRTICPCLRGLAADSHRKRAHLGPAAALVLSSSGHVKPAAGE